MEDTAEIIEAIRNQGDLFEVVEVRKFRGLLKDSNEEVDITVVDNGKEDAGRYIASAEVVDDPSRVSASNLERTIKQAIFGVHWGELKRRG